MSIRFQVDADLNFDIVRAVRRQEPAINFLSAIDSQLRGVKGPELLEWAAAANLVLVSHDRRTMLHHFRHRLAGGKSSPGLLIVSQSAPIGSVVESIVVLWSVSQAVELCDQAYYQLESMETTTFAPVASRRVVRSGLLPAINDSSRVRSLRRSNLRALKYWQEFGNGVPFSFGQIGFLALAVCRQ